MNNLGSVYMFVSNKNWILDGIVKDASRAINSSINVIYVPRGKREALNLNNTIKWVRQKRIDSGSLFMGYEVLQFVTESKASMGDGFRLFFTHHNLNFELNNYQQILDRVHTVYTMNQRVSQLLLSTGIEETKIRCVYGAVDREKFFPKAGKAEMGTNNFCLHGESEYVLISGDCKERKNPALILSVVKQNPSLNFVIHGRGWENMVRNFSGSNLTYIKFDSRSHPILMRNASTYLSLSSLEGGPYPTLEALASGTPVVATNTGWNSEVIPDGAGVILPINTGTSEVTTALRYSIERKPKVEGKDLLMGKFTWEELGAALFPETK